MPAPDGPGDPEPTTTTTTGTAQTPDVVGAGISGLLEVQVVLADEATVQAVTEAVSAWLRPDQVVIAGALQPLAADASSAPRS